MRPFVLIAFPLGIFVCLSLIVGNMSAWQQACGSNLACNPTFQVLPSNSPFLLLITGRFDILWSNLTGPTFDWSLLGALLSIIVGGLLLLLSLGITFSYGLQALASGVSGSFGMNEQGTRLVQMLGIGLLIWGVTVSTIGGWESTFDGVAQGLGAAFNILLEFVFITGILWQSQSIAA